MQSSKDSKDIASQTKFPKKSHELQLWLDFARMILLSAGLELQRWHRNFAANLTGVRGCRLSLFSLS
jgi:hypothetical protein